MEVSSPRQALGKIGEMFCKEHAPNLIDINVMVEAGLRAPQSCPADLLDEAAEALTSLLKSDRNHSVTHTLAVQSKARTTLGRIVASPRPVSAPAAPMMPFAAPKDAAERWNIVLSIARGGFGGAPSDRLQAIESLAANRSGDPAARGTVPEVILVAARWARNAWTARTQEAERRAGFASAADEQEIAQLTEALAAYEPPKPPTTEELAAALRDLVNAPLGRSISDPLFAKAQAVLDRMPK